MQQNSKGAPTAARVFHYMAFRVVTWSGSQELVVLRLPRPMSAGRELQQVMHEVQQQLEGDVGYKLANCLGASEAFRYANGTSVQRQDSREGQPDSRVLAAATRSEERVSQQRIARRALQ